MTAALALEPHPLAGLPEVLHTRPLAAAPPLLGPGDVDDVLDALEDLRSEADVARLQDEDLHSEASAAELRQRLEALRACAVLDAECLAAAGLLEIMRASLAVSAGVDIETLLAWSGADR